MPYGSWVKQLPAGFFLAVQKDVGGTVILT
jgi:hypothetical protein